MNHHGNKQRKSGVTACTTVRQVRLQPPPVASSLAIRHWEGDGPLHSKLLVTKVEPLETGGDTHTHTLALILSWDIGCMFEKITVNSRPGRGCFVQGR